MKNYLFLFLTILYSPICKAQVDLYELGKINFQNFIESEGLGSTEVYDITKDKFGQIWCSHDNGISQLKGNEIINYNSRDGLFSNSVYKIFADINGKIWSSGNDHKLNYIENGIIYNYEHNDIILNCIPKRSIIQDLYCDNTGTIHLAYSLGGYLRIFPNGKFAHCGQKDFKNSIKTGFFFTIIDDHIMNFGYNLFNQSNNKLIQPKLIYEAVYNKSTNTFKFLKRDEFNIDFNKNKSKSTLKNTIIRKNGDFIFSFRSHLFKVSNSKKDIYYFDNALTRLYDIEGDIWAGFFHDGARRILVKDKKMCILDGMSVTGICKDDYNGFWFSTLESGVFYAPNIDIKTIQLNINANPLSAFIMETGELLIGYENGTLLLVNNKGTTIIQAANTGIIFNIKKIDHKIIVFTSYGMFELRRKKLHLINHKNNINKKDYSFKNLILVNDSCSVLCCRNTIIVNSNKNVGREIKFDGLIRAIHSTDSIIYIGTNSGLTMLEINSESKPFKKQLLSDAPVSIIVGHKNVLLVFTDDKNIIHITNDSIFETSIPNYIDGRIRCAEFIDNHLYIGTSNGLVISSFNELNFKQKITTSNGLSSNDIKGISFDKNSIYLTLRNALDILPRNLDFTIYSPEKVNLRIIVDGINQNESQIELNYDFRNLDIEMDVLSPFSKDQIAYRYQLTMVEEKPQITREVKVSYGNLRSGNYILTVAASYDGINFGEDLSVPIRVHFPFWLTPWFILFFSISIIILSWMIILSRLRKIKSKVNIKSQLLELKGAALRAQMNPHFSYNVLNAIQSMIITRKENMATEYLSSFAAYLRKTILFSDKNLITISEEIKLCEDYIKLEQLRFKNRIQFIIQVDSEISLTHSIPPMLIQPLIENAILHGLKNKIKGGIIKIVFKAINDKKYQIQICDNGEGFLVKDENKLHVSKGINLVKERIKMINKNSKLLINRAESMTIVKVETFYV